jgi:serine/threonine protein kinase
MRFLGRLPSFSNKKVIPVSLRKSTSSIDTGVTIQTSQLAKSLSYSFSSVEDEVSYCEFSVKEETHALSFWEPVCLLGQGSISDIHLVKRRKRKNFAKVKLGSDNDITNGCRRTKSWSRKSNDDTKSKDLYVLKSIAKGHLGDEDVLAEMRLEIDTMSKLSHPNICSVVEAYSLRDQSYLRKPCRPHSHVRKSSDQSHNFARSGSRLPARVWHMPS